MSSAGEGSGGGGAAPGRGGVAAAEEEEEVEAAAAAAAASAAARGLAAAATTAEEEERLTSALPNCAETVADATPGTFNKARSTAPEHDAQLIPRTSRRTISVMACARATPATAARKPTPSTAAMRSEGFSTEASKMTSAASCRRATDAEWTPGSALLDEWIDGKGGKERKSERERKGERKMRLSFRVSFKRRPKMKVSFKHENEPQTHLRAPSTAEEHEEQCIPWIESYEGLVCWSRAGGRKEQG